MKKLLFITKNFPPEVGGGIRRIEAIYKILSTNKNIDFNVITAVKSASGVSPNVKYIKQLFFKDKKNERGISFTKAFDKIKLIDKALVGWVPNVLLNIICKKYDYLFVSTPSFSNIIAGFIYKKLRFNKPKIIVEYRDFFSFNPCYINNFKKKVLNYFEKKILENSDSVIVTTQAMMTILSKYIDKKKIFLIRNSISRYDIKITDMLKKIEFDRSFYNIGYVGKLNTGRDPSDILKILNTTIDNKKIKLYFIGINESEKDFIVKKSGEMNLDIDRIIFEKPVNRDNSLQYMKSFDGLLLIINNKVLVKDGYGIPGKLYDYIYINNNIFSDKETFDNIKCEFEYNVKKRFDNFVNFSINHKEKLDEIFNDTINSIVR